MSDETLNKLAEDTAEVKRLIEDRIANDQVKEKAFDQLYTELKQYKDDWLYQNEKPLLVDLLLFFDSMHWYAETLKSAEQDKEALIDGFQYMVDELLEVLYRRDVTPMEPSANFDAKFQKAVKVETTDDEALNQQVKQVLKRGFMRGERMLRAEEVIITRVKK
jgi:molecular chaperone GrpE (heat shock protein)